MTSWLHISTSPNLHRFHHRFEDIISSPASLLRLTFAALDCKTHRWHQNTTLTPRTLQKYLPIAAASSYPIPVSFFDSGIQFYRTLVTSSFVLKVRATLQ
jgi:hypothetical protein